MCVASMLGSWPAVADNRDSRFDSFPTYSGTDLELDATVDRANFRLWSPEAEAVKLSIYPTDRNTAAIETVEMNRSTDGTWTASLPGNYYGKFYTFSVKHKGRWLDETPGVWAKAVGTNIGSNFALIFACRVREHLIQLVRPSL